MAGFHWQTFLQAIANKAREAKHHRFGDLYRWLNEKVLRVCFYRLRKDAASGVDGVTFQDYEKNLEANLEDLVGRLKRKAYRARLVRRKYIPKSPGKLRPLGIPALEDKLLQMAVSQILMAIYEEDFLADVLDRWFEDEVRKGNQGRCELCRFADDFVACFEYRHEAVAFERGLKERLAEFGLEVAEEKTHRDLSDGVLLAESEESTPEFQLAELQPTATPF